MCTPTKKHSFRYLLGNKEFRKLYEWMKQERINAFTQSATLAKLWTWDSKKSTNSRERATSSVIKEVD